MKRILSILLLVNFWFSCDAATSITTTTVSGHWTLSGSPYKIFSDITIDAGQTLTIDAGVDVIFQGHYSITVPSGSHLIAIGTSGQNINFKANDTTGWYDKTTTQGGWNGMTITGNLFSPTPTDSPFAYCNFSDIKTGKIRVYARSYTFKNCIFFHNHTTGDAYGSTLLRLDADTTDQIEVYQCHFYNNNLDNLCRVVHTSGSANTYIHECTFNDNQAISALYCSNNNVLVENNKFYNNVQLTDLSVTGMVTIWYSKAVLKGNKIYKNTDKECGSLVCHDSYADINGNVICNNTSTKGFTSSAACGSSQGGGAIRISADDSTKNYYCTIRDNVIANNFAAYSGGAIYVWRISVGIFNNHIIHNSSGDGSGGYLTSAGIHLDNNPITAGRNTARIKNNLFYGNVGYGTYNTFSLWLWGGDTIEYAHNWSNNSSHMYDLWDGGATGYTYIGGDSTTNMLGTNPAMIDPTSTATVTDDAMVKNFALQPSSPCINAGDSTGTNADAYDVTNHPRIYGSSIDIGAHEYGPWTATLTIPANTMLQNNFKIYPNPASGTLFIATTSPSGVITIEDISGRQIAEISVTSTLTSVDIHTIPGGIYFAVWNDQGNRSVQKLIVE